MTEQDIREKFESWAAKQGHSLIRHPNNDDFYYNRDVSALWVCFTTAYIMGRNDENAFLKDLLDLDWEDKNISAQKALIERTVSLDD